VTAQISKLREAPLVRGKGLLLTDEEERRALAYINGVEWKFAKTMPQWPHSYTVVTWNPHLETEFRWLAGMIQRDGIREQWAKGRYATGLYVGSYKYWIMSAPKDCILINRADVIASGPSKPLK
jgi:hypothetical protein